MWNIHLLFNLLRMLQSILGPEAKYNKVSPVYRLFFYSFLPRCLTASPLKNIEMSEILTLTVVTDF